MVNNARHNTPTRDELTALAPCVVDTGLMVVGFVDVTVVDALVVEDFLVVLVVLVVFVVVELLVVVEELVEVVGVVVVLVVVEVLDVLFWTISHAKGLDSSKLYVPDGASISKLKVELSEEEHTSFTNETLSASPSYLMM